MCVLAQPIESMLNRIEATIRFMRCVLVETRLNAGRYRVAHFSEYERNTSRRASLSTPRFPLVERDVLIGRCIRLNDPLFQHSP